MSLQVNLSSPDIKSAYDDVLGGSADYLLLTYEKGNNDLKVQEVEKGELEDMLFEFSSGRMQYGFVRVKDPNTQLAKYVLINWCGEGVPDARKGLFPSHASAVAQFLKGYHVSINARREDDLDAKAIMKKVNDSSGSKYTAAGQSANTQMGGRIEPVGSSYKPVGAPDIASLRKGATADKIAPVGSSYKPAREELSSIRSGGAGASVPDAPRPQPAKPVPAPAPAPAQAPMPKAPAVGGIIGNVPSAPAPAPAAPAPIQAAAPAKPSDDDRIRPVGTAYEPVRLGKPGKLGNRFPFGQQAQESAPAAVPAPRPSGGLTWSQRQEKAKQEREEEDARSRAASGQAADADAAIEDAPPPPAPPAPPAPALDEVTQGLSRASIAPTPPAGASTTIKGGLHAVAVYDYAAAEDNEISFAEGDKITNIDQVDEGWWSGVTSDGQEGLFPATYVELVEGEQEGEPAAPPPPPAPPAPPAAPPAPIEAAVDDAPPPPPPPPPMPPMSMTEEAPAAPPAPSGPPVPLSVPDEAAPALEEGFDGVVAIAQYDYEAAEENELGFAENDRIIAIEFASDDWWSGTLERTGEVGLFPANYVEVQQ